MYTDRPCPRAVLFDFFGTLSRAVRRGPRHARIARSLGVEPPVLAAQLDRTFYVRASGAYGAPDEALRRILDGLSVRQPDDATLRRALVARIGAVRADTVLRRNAVSVLAAVRRRGLRTAVVSDCWYELPAFLPGLPVAPHLDACVFSLDVGHCKPDPRMYLAACDRLGVEPDECLYVGDGGSRELSGAEAVGIAPLRLRAPDLRGHLVFRPDEWTGPAVGSLGEVVRVVEGRRPARQPIAA
jgi:putative hydrolase of the HAD superfamily